MKLFSKIKDNPLLSFLIVLLILAFGAFVGVLFFEYIETYISKLLGSSNKNEALKFLGISMGGILIALQALMSYRRAKAMEDAVEKTEQGQRQDRLKNAIEHLGHESDSVRLGGAYELFHLAKDTLAEDTKEKLSQTVLDILCAHVRRTTSKSKYREKYKSKPSEEVQSLLTLLFVQEHEVFKGCHINLQGSWLNGANLQEACLEKAILSEVHLKKANLVNTRLQGAILFKAHLQGAFLMGAHMRQVSLVESHMQRAILSNAHLQGSILNDARLHGAIMTDAQMQETGLNGAHLQAANLALARMQMASLGGAQMQGAYLHMAKLHGATLSDAQMQGANLSAAQLHEAKFSSLQGLQHYSNTLCQEVNPEPAQLQGVRSSVDSDSSIIVHPIRDQKNKESDLYGVIFAGGLSEEDVDSCVEGLSDAGARKLRVRLQPHIGQPISHELPENSGATTGTYSEEEAEKWIAEYEQAISEVPGDDS